MDVGSAKKDGYLPVIGGGTVGSMGKETRKGKAEFTLKTAERGIVLLAARAERDWGVGGVWWLGLCWGWFWGVGGGGGGGGRKNTQIFNQTVERNT